MPSSRKLPIQIRVLSTSPAMLQQVQVEHLSFMVLRADPPPPTRIQIHIDGYAVTQDSGSSTATLALLLKIWKALFGHSSGGTPSTCAELRRSQLTLTIGN